jgi:hypothetical protein
MKLHFGLPRTCHLEKLMISSMQIGHIEIFKMNWPQQYLSALERTVVVVNRDQFIKGGAGFLQVSREADAN